ncbi:hypothetical protein P700755_002129 [Psychroflexus torquis ATCC 700755]|uniref:Uncharacterized protein n=1 Tax=Psychroflexus torquis (strain ATCC 700755 / CIP 106069 / ACAM 623) TaxID=313595 RepID=K4ITV8_PSYTT|nr:hypothetical protein P700755_002129 [Psychroflexus torquis ATCC 700755]
MSMLNFSKPIKKSRISYKRFLNIKEKQMGILIKPLEYKLKNKI